MTSQIDTSRCNDSGFTGADEHVLTGVPRIEQDRGTTAGEDNRIDNTGEATGQVFVSQNISTNRTVGSFDQS